jgi:hypothetical protein
MVLFESFPFQGLASLHEKPSARFVFGCRFMDGDFVYIIIDEINSA